MCDGFDLKFKKVDVLGKTVDVPINSIDNGKDVTIIFIIERDKLNFLLNTALTIVKCSGMTAFSTICLDCTKYEISLWAAKGVHSIESQALLDISKHSFRTNGPMSYELVLPAGDKRRHSIHMYYREWMKYIFLENNITVFLADVDVCMRSSIKWFMKNEDVVVSGRWHQKFRPGEYSFSYISDKPNVFIELNNGLALFTPSLAFMKYQREFMAFMTHEVVVNYGFAQTSFTKTMISTNLSLSVVNKRELVGSNAYGVTVRAIKPGFHPAGEADWDKKEQQMKNTEGCWLLPMNWEELWIAANSLHSLLQLIE